MSAFDWSPGGCCCSSPGWFDLYAHEVVSQDFLRTASIRPVNAVSPFNSLTLPWSIPPIVPNSRGPMRSQAGYTRDGRTVWATELHDTGGGSASVNTFLTCYYVLNKTQLCSVLASQMSNGNFATPNNRENIYVGIDQLAEKSVGTSAGNIAIRVLSTNGTIDTWGNDINDGVQISQVVAFPITTTTTENLLLPACLDWPKWTAETRIKAGQSGVTPITTNVAFFICDISRPSGGDNNLRFINRVPVRTINGPGQLRGFDQFNGKWATVIHDNEPYQSGFGAPFLTGPRTLELRINGQIIWTRQMPDVGAFGLIYEFQSPAFAPHVCYPHETLGDGFVAVPELVWPNYPQYTGSNGYLAVYRTGVSIPIWKTINLPSAPTVLGSTDRWIYFRTQTGVSVSSMTNGKISMPGDTNATQYWMARHDGTEILPMGSLRETLSEMSGAPFVFTPFDCMMRDSTAAPGTIPASYQEMFDGL